MALAANGRAAPAAGRLCDILMAMPAISAAVPMTIMTPMTTTRTLSPRIGLDRMSLSGLWGGPRVEGADGAHG